MTQETASRLIQAATTILTVGIGALVQMWRSSKGRKRTNSKIDDVHTIVNGNSTVQQAKLDSALASIESLKNEIARLNGRGTTGDNKPLHD